jgi:hypothetical protein
MVFSLNEFALAQRDSDPHYPWDWHRAMLAQIRRAGDYYYGDYYPLTACGLDLEAWLAYQLHLPPRDGGMILAFRRPQSPMASGQFRLTGLTPGAAYAFEDADGGEGWQEPADRLLSEGLKIVMTSPRSSKLLFYSHAG